MQPSLDNCTFSDFGVPNTRQIFISRTIIALYSSQSNLALNHIVGIVFLITWLPALILKLKHATRKEFV